MKPPLTAAVRIAITVGSLLVATLASAGDERTKWWQSEQSKAEIGLSGDQSRQLEKIFQETLPRMRVEKDELDRQEHRLSKLMTEAATAEADFSQAIDRVEDARARASKTRMLMLYRMYQVLTPEQRKKLDAVHDHRRSGPGTPRPH